MTVITPQAAITCDNKDIDCCAAFKKCIVVDSVGNWYIRTWGGGGGGSANTETGTFTNADLVVETLTIDGVTDDYKVYKFEHGLDTLAPGLTVIDNNLQQVQLSQQIVSADESWIIVGSSTDTITGTWQFQFNG